MLRLNKIFFICAALCFLLPAFSGCQGPDAWEERHDRDQPPEKILDTIGVGPGMVIGEIGAGRGRYTVKLAARVGERGKVYANDIDELALRYLEYRCERDGISNIVTILGEVRDPKLPKSALDIAFMINTYHHLDDPVELMRNVRASLKPEGRLAIVEHEPEKAGPGWESDSTPRKVLMEQASQAGYELVKATDESFTPRDLIYVFRLSETKEEK